MGIHPNETMVQYHVKTSNGAIYEEELNTLSKFFFKVPKGNARNDASTKYQKHTALKLKKEKETEKEKEPEAVPPPPPPPPPQHYRDTRYNDDHYYQQDNHWNQ